MTVARANLLLVCVRTYYGADTELFLSERELVADLEAVVANPVLGSAVFLARLNGRTDTLERAVAIELSNLQIDIDALRDELRAGR